MELNPLKTVLHKQPPEHRVCAITFEVEIGECQQPIPMYLIEAHNLGQEKLLLY